MKRDEAKPMDEFEAGNLDIARSAISVSDLILDAAVHKIDALFGKGFAQANPRLVGQYLDATTRTFQNTMASIADLGDDFDFELDLEDTPLPPPTRNRRK